MGAIFHAPLAGALFASEILYRTAEFESDVLIPAVLSSSVAYCLFCYATGSFGHLFALEGDFRFDDVAELAPYTVLALVLVPAAFLYARGIRWTAVGVERLPGPRALWAAAGGLLCGSIGVGLYLATDDQHALSVLSHGYGVIQSSLHGELSGWGGARLLLLIGGFKIATTALTVSAGGSGGVFGPAIVIGGCIGGAVGLVAVELGMTGLNPGTFVIVGMAGFFSGAARTPISTLIMVSELTGGYSLLLPSMWVCGLTFLLCSPWSIFQKQVPSRAFSGAHRGEFLVPLLQALRVADVLEVDRRPTTVRHDTPLAEVVHLIARTRDDYYPVLDDEGRFVGIFTAHDVREHTFDPHIHQLAIVADVMTTDPITLRLDHDLHVAMSRFNRKNLDELPVVDAEDPGKLLGMLRRRALIRAYNEQLDELKELQRGEG